MLGKGGKAAVLCAGLALFAAGSARAQEQQPTQPATPPNPAPAEEPPKGHVVMGEDLGGGNGLSFASSDGNFSLRLGFWGQFRFQLYDKDQWRRTSRTILTPPIPVENIGETQE